ncbi:MAG: CotH kinase family protein [Saprospiraceae bacterium]|nr:CotH kinase family protein [Saprospiraceae bacterium]
MNLARELGMYASRTRYVEVILNGNYQGVYVFMEKVKRDKGRVDIDKLDDDENSGDDLTGGYILKIDKFTGSIGGSFTSDFKTQYGKDIHYQYDTPKDPTSQQANYIQNFIRTFENTVNNANYKDPDVGYRKYADVESFVKYFLINEFARNMDGFRISTFMHKDKDSRGGKLKMGPAWDLTFVTAMPIIAKEIGTTYMRMVSMLFVPMIFFKFLFGGINCLLIPIFLTLPGPFIPKSVQKVFSKCLESML